MSRTQLEPTSKIYKAIIAVGVVLAIIGIIRFVANMDTNPGAGTIQVVFGFILFIIGKVLAWWKHG
ncbi:hypothetical protein VPH49_24220 [Pseudomonas luteola]|uniref:hypothetical protein n=1 Tax=Pseudomonas luteola TaxID=47886 RepID=UPI003A844D6B